MGLESATSSSIPNREHPYAVGLEENREIVLLDTYNTIAEVEAGFKKHHTRSIEEMTENPVAVTKVKSGMMADRETEWTEANCIKLRGVMGRVISELGDKQ